MLEENRVFQHAYYVGDLEEACRQWAALYGAGPFLLVPHHRTARFEYRGTGQEADVSYAFGYWGDLMIQFIEQHDDTPSIYRELYRPAESGFHHIGILVRDVDAATQRFVDMGFEVACSLYADGVDAIYLDTRSVNGGYTELHGNPDHILSAFRSWRQAHDRRSPGDHWAMERS